MKSTISQVGPMDRSSTLGGFGWTRDQKLSSEVLSSPLHSAITVWLFLRSPFTDTAQYCHSAWLFHCDFLQDW